MKNNINTTYIAYVPHGINSKYFKPLFEGDDEFVEFKKFETAFKEQYNCDFIVFWNNRNVRRKQPGDVVLSFKEFQNKVLTKHPGARLALLMHTQPVDENGTDLIAVHNNIAPECTIIFSSENISTQRLNFYYNLADVTLNIASNEGFGLSGAESLMAGTPIVNNVTGGLQDQCRFEDDQGSWINFDSEFTSNHTGRYKKHAPWAKPVFPASRSLQGSIPTPYIFDDRCNFEDVANALLEWFQTPKEERLAAGLKAREWMLSKESGMSAHEMSNRFVRHLEFIIDRHQPPKKYSFEKVELNKRPGTPIGITPNYLI